jgi:glycosyltransferase involved in cell wall biosynthesis
MDRARFTNRVVSWRDRGALAPSIEAAGVRVEPVRATFGLGSARAFVRLVTLLRRERPQILQTWLYHSDLIGLEAARLAGIRTVVWNIRSTVQRRRDQSALGWWTMGALARLSDRPRAIVANSRAGIASHQARGYRCRRWELIPNGFELPERLPGREERARLAAELGLPESAPWIGLVARHHPVKDHPTFLRAAALLVARQPSARFLLVGRGVEQLAEQARELGLAARVRLLGERQDVMRITACLDLAASSSVNEAFSNTLGEAMACGVPCVATDVGDSAEIVGDTGRIVPPANPEALAAAMSDLLDLPASERLALGQSAAARIRERFSLAHTIARYEELYVDLA